MKDSHGATKRLTTLACVLIAALSIAAPSRVLHAQDDPLELICSDNVAKLDGGPWGPDTIKVRIGFARNVVELLDEDGVTMKQDRGAVITARTIKWGVGIHGLNTWQSKGLNYNVSNFEGTIDREAGTGRIYWERSESRQKTFLFSGKCRPITTKF